MTKDKKKTLDLIIKIILVIIIIILLIHNCTILKKVKNERIPTGNVDIIEITCDNDDKCDVDNNKNKDNKDQNNDGNASRGSLIPNKNIDNKTVPASGGDNTEPVIEESGLIVNDKSITWNGSTNVRIFENSMYELNNIIAPESSNTYQFVVKNRTDYNLKYNINFVENNPYSINMKYKLRKNDTYLIDHYVSASELNIENMQLNIDKNDTYYLEWKWVSADNDTEIGATSNAKYELKIEVEAESD